MSEQTSEVQDSEFLYSHLSEYQDDILDVDQKKRFEAALDEVGKEIPGKYAEALGHFQAAYQKYSLTEVQLHELRSLVEDDVSRADHEAGNIKELGSTELRGNTVRAVTLLAMIFGVFLVSYYFLAPPSKVSFDALGTLVYEATAMSDDNDRLNYPTTDISEVRSYLQKYPRPGFTPVLFGDLESDWAVEGATVIDYEFVKIFAVQFNNEVLGEKLFWFQFPGGLEDMPAAEIGKYNDLTYQTYEDQNYNIIVFPMSDGVLGMMVGRRGDPEMAKLAFSSMATDKQ